MTQDNSKAEQEILYHLQREPHLTAKQLAILRRPDQEHCLTSELMPSNLSGTTRLLNRMAAKKLIKYAEHEYGLRRYCLPKTKLLAGNYKHERLCGDLYVAFRPDYWKVNHEIKEYSIKPDRVMVHFGKLVFWEVDRNTESYNKVIREKLDKYTQMSKDNPVERFHVIFTTVDTNRQTALKRCEGLLDMFYTYKRGDQFMTTLHEFACRNPDKNSFVTPLHQMGRAIAEPEEVQDHVQSLNISQI